MKRRCCFDLPVQLIKDIEKLCGIYDMSKDELIHEALYRHVQQVKKSTGRSAGTGFTRTK